MGAAYGNPDVSRGDALVPIMQLSGASINYEIWGKVTSETVWYTAFNGLGLDMASFKGFWDPKFGPDAAMLIFEPRGTGSSTRGTNFTVEDVAGDVVELWDALGIERSIALAICMGCNIAICLAALVPERISRLHLVSSSPAARFYAEGYDEWSVDPAHVYLRAALVLSPGYHRLLPKFVDVYAKQMLQRLHSPAYLADFTHFRRVVHAAALDLLMPRVSAPTFILHGENDALIPPAAARYLAAGIPGARLTILPDAGHCLFGPPAANDSAMQAFLSMP